MTAPFREAKIFAGGDFDVTPQARDLVGRLVIVKPTRFEAKRLTGFKDEKTGAPVLKDTVWADVLILDAAHLGLVGGPLEYGGDGKAIPNTDRINTPAHFKDVMMGQTLIAAFLKAEMDDPQYAGFSLGVVYLSDKGKQGSPPLVLGPVRTTQWGQERPRGEELWAFAGAEFARWASGQMNPATVSDLIPPPPHGNPEHIKAYQERVTKRATAQAQRQQDQAPAQYAPQASQYAAPPSYTPPVAVTYQAPAQAVATQYAPGNPPQPQYAQPMAPSYQAPTYQAPVSAPPAPFDYNQVPTVGGWTAEIWANVPEAGRRVTWDAIRAH